jgi:hypothetical protein
MGGAPKTGDLEKTGVKWEGCTVEEVIGGRGGRGVGFFGKVRTGVDEKGGSTIDVPVRSF